MPKRTDDAAIAKLRAICMALPETNEKISHGEPTWFAGKGKVFAMLDNHHHGSPHLAVWLPQSPEGLADTSQNKVSECLRLAIERANMPSKARVQQRKGHDLARRLSAAHRVVVDAKHLPHVNGARDAGQGI